MTEKHLSSQFDTELGTISTRVLEMGGLVESQVAQAVAALTTFNGEEATRVLVQEITVNQMEVSIDADLSTIIARRQPTARDLRLLIAISKTIGNLERVGDEAARVARTVQRLINTGVSTRLRLPVSDLQFASELATASLRRALDAFARLDTQTAIEVIRAESGQPSILLHGSTAARAEEIGAKQIHLTLTHTKDTAAASVVIMG